MAKDNKKSEKIVVKYKAADPKLFAMNYTDKVPYYDELSKFFKADKRQKLAFL